MKKCKSCQKEIDKKASVCPYCQSKQVSKSVQVITGIVIIFIVLGVFGAIFGGGKNSSSTQKADNSTQTTEKKEVQQPTIVEATTLIGEFDKNKLAANDKYNGELVETTGYIKNISNDITGNYYLSLNPNNEAYYFGTTITCYFTEKNELTSLSNGQSVTVQGTMQEMTLGIVAMKDCKVVK